MGWAFGFGIICLLVFLLIRHTKWTLLSIGAVITLGTIGGVGWWLYDARLAAKNHVLVETTVDVDQCTPSYPVYVYVENNSSKHLERVTIGLKQARKNMTPQGWRTHDIVVRSIIPPRYTYRNCHKFSDLTDSINAYGATDVYIQPMRNYFSFADREIPEGAIVDRIEQLRKQAALAKAAARAKTAGEQRYQDYRVVGDPSETQYAFPPDTTFEEMYPVFVLEWHGENTPLGQVEPKK